MRNQAILEPPNGQSLILARRFRHKRLEMRVDKRFRKFMNWSARFRGPLDAYNNSPLRIGMSSRIPLQLLRRLHHAPRLRRHFDRRSFLRRSCIP